MKLLKRRIFKNKLVFPVLCLGASLASYAQPADEFRMINSYYPNESVVVTKKSTSLNIQTLKTGLSVNASIFCEKIYLDNKAGAYSEESVSYTEFGMVKDIQAVTLLPGRRKYSEEKVKAFETNVFMGNGNIFYDGSKRVSFLYPALQAKAKTRLKYSKDFSEPRLIDLFFFQESEPVMESEYTIVTTPDVELGWTQINTNDSDCVFKKSAVKDKIVYSWKMKNLDKYESESGSPGFRHYSPHVITWIKSYKLDGKSVSVLGTTKELYDWYAGHIKKVKNEFCQDLKTVADSLVKGESNEIEKVKKVYSWVQNNIKYIAMEDGMGGFVPRSGKTVYEKRYGDCKDMASIIHTMLSYEGIPSYLTWVGTSSLPYTYEQVPTPATDNHMITTYVNGGKYYFLDATGNYTPFGVSSHFIQGKEVLIGMDSTKFEVRQVPVTPCEQSAYIDSVKIRIDKTKLLGSGNTTLTGYYAIRGKDILLHQKKPLTLVLRDFSEKGNNKFLVDSAQLYRENENNQPFGISYYFNIGDYIKQNNDELYVNLHLNKDLQAQEIEKNRKLGVERSINGTSVSVVELQVPEGYKVEYLPGNSVYEGERFGFSINYSQAGSVVRLTTRVNSCMLLLEKNDFESWNQMIKQLNRNYSELVVLKKK